MRADRERWAPLTGIVFVVLVIAGAVTATNAPDTSADGANVIDYYHQHEVVARVSAVMLTLAFIALVFFAAAMRSYLRRRGADGLAAVVLAGASILAAGQTLTEGFRWALANDPTRLVSASAQTLNVAANNVVLVSTAGWFIFAVGAWLAIVRDEHLPSWLGWVSLAIGIIVLTPLEFAGFLIFVVWTAAASVMIWRRWPDPVSTTQPAMPAIALRGAG